MTEPNAALEAALSYAAAGLPVFPCQGKRPITPNGFKDASTGKAVIRAWWKDEPYNVAIALPEWLVVLDVDGPQGEQALKDHGFVPPITCSVATPRGRHHYYIWKGERPPLRKIGLLPKVDVLSNGFVVAPPSKGYSWLEPFNPDHIEIAPDWLSLTLREEAAHRQSIDAEEFFRGLPRGERQTGLFRYACRLRAMPRMTRTEAKVLVRELAKISEGEGYGRYPDTDALVERVWKTYDAAEEDKPNEEGKVWSLSDLLSEVVEPPNYLVDKLLPGVGYTILFAAQGVGKSVLADQVAVSVATGSKIFGKEVRRAGVLVLDVEQDPANAAERWRRLLHGLALENVPANLYTSFTWPSLGDGGFEKIGSFLVEHPHVQLVVVDTLGQLWDGGEEGDSNAYFRDGRAMGRFTRFANEYGIAFLLIHHSRKGNSNVPDSFADAASGSRGLTGPAKARWWLKRKELSEHGDLVVGGKIPESSISLTFDKEFLVWR